MLNAETKKIINSARDVLVGKIPDPKAQVEQITFAMFYKFMDEKDKESIQLGGKPQFFVDRFESFSWSKLMDPRLGGTERMDLYTQALAKMSQNPHIAQLFRDIYKDAFIPFRSPETLSLFLKEIDQLDYTNTESLGDAFEYLLSVMGSQGDAGQFRTPRHIIDFIVDVVDPQKSDSILDPACGTAGFLISSYKHIVKQHDGKDDPGNKETPLTPDEKKDLMKNLMGYDISPDMVRLSKVNLYLHGLPNPTIYEYDTLSSEEKWDENFDVILANPPFMSPKGGIKPHKRFSIQANRAEVLFVDYIIEHLKPNGKAGIIVPEGIIFQSSNAYKELRKKLVEDGLFAVVSLPSGVFNPYAGVKTSILLFDKEISKRSKHILFVKINSDGFDLGAQRREHSKNDLPEALEIIKKWKSFFVIPAEAGIQCLSVAKEKIAESGDYNLSGDRYKEVVSFVNQKWPMVELDEVCEIKRGFAFKSSDYQNDGILNFRVTNIGDDGSPDLMNVKYLPREFANKYKDYLLNEDDFVIVMVGATTGKMGIITKQILPALLNQNMWRFEPIDKNKINKKYLYYIIGTLEGIKQGGARDYLKQSDFSKIKIPLPPIEVQNEIVEQIKKYQNIVDGAKQIINNYKPTIKVDSAWQVVELGNLFLETKLGLVKDKSMQADIFPYPYIKMENISIDGNLELRSVVHVEATKEELLKYTLNNGDFIYNTRNAPNLVGKSAVYHGDDRKYLFNNNILRIRFKNEVNTDYINYYLNTDEGKRKIKVLVSGTTSVAAIYQKNFATITIPLPPIDIQKQIVAEIEYDRECVTDALKIIKNFETKISKLINDIL